VNADGYVYFEMLTRNTATDYLYLFREYTTTMKVQKGWNYIAMLFDEIYDYTYITMYLRTENNVSPNLFSKYQTYIPGVREYGLDDTIVIGCYTNLGMGSTGSTQATSSTWANPPGAFTYGLCMKGWMNTIEIYR
jgi:hypothetical protein